MVSPQNRRRYPWLITQADELPEFDPDRVSRFFEASFDEDCGWIRKPNSSGTEQGKDGPDLHHRSVWVAGDRQ